MRFLIELLKTSTITLTKDKMRANGLASILVVAAVVILALHDKLKGILALFAKTGCLREAGFVTALSTALFLPDERVADLGQPRAFRAASASRNTVSS